MLQMMPATQPPHRKWLLVVVMMGVYTFGPTNLTRLTNKVAVSNRRFHSVMCEMNNLRCQLTPSSRYLGFCEIALHSSGVQFCLKRSLTSTGTELPIAALNLRLNSRKLQITPHTNSGDSLAPFGLEHSCHLTTLL